MRTASRGCCAVRRGVLTVRGGNEIAIATREAQLGDDLDTLETSVLTRFRADVEAERAGAYAAMRLHTQAVRRIVDALRSDGRQGGRRVTDRTGWTCYARSATAASGIMIGCARASRPSGATSRRLAFSAGRSWCRRCSGVFLGRWIDRNLGTGIFWTGPLMLIGLGAGCWTAWNWMHGR